jgi:hypothetical protein
MDQPQEHPEQPGPGGPPGQAFTQDFRHTPIAARIPEKIGRGVFSTATMILQTGQEFMIDFLATMAQPQQVVARVVLTPGTFAQFVAALRMNIGKFEQEFGPLALHPPAMPGTAWSTGTAPAAPPPSPATGLGTESIIAGEHGSAAGQHPPAAAQQPPAASAPPPHSITELYEQLKLPDEMLGGVFANAVMIRHTPFEFCFDFIANFYPRSVVTARVYLTAGRVLSLLDAMSSAWQKYQQTMAGGAGPAP